MIGPLVGMLLVLSFPTVAQGSHDGRWHVEERAIVTEEGDPAPWSSYTVGVSADGELPLELSVPLDANYVFGEKVSPRTQTSVVDSLAYAASFVEEVTGYKNEDFTLFAFMDSEPLVEHYMNFYNIPAGQRTEILNRWRTPRWEAGRGNIFALLGTELTDPLDAATLHPITHEYVHVIQWSFAPNTYWGPDDPLPTGPYWLGEGIAEYFAFLHRSSQASGMAMEQTYRNLVQVANHSDAPLESMESWSGMENAGTESAYALGTIAAFQLAERSGVKALLEYSEAVGNTGNWRLGFEHVFGLSVEQFYEDFEDPRDLSTFRDDDGSVFEGDIEWLASTGITRGCNPPINDRFCPDDPVTRGQMAAFLNRALNLEPGTDTFTDTRDSVFTADIGALAGAGVTRGCNPPANDEFCPGDPVTRGQMAAFLVRAFGYSDDGGGDLFIDDNRSVFEGEIDRLGTAGVTRGCNPPTNDRFCPGEPVTRGQMAAFIHRALGD